jgi:negative regulator of sigma E activity
MDGEAGELETRRLLDEMARDEELRDAWDRFHLARSAMAGDPLDVTDGTDATRRLWNAVDAGAGEESDEAVGQLPRRPFGLRSGAAAIGLAAAVVLAVWLYPVAEFGSERFTAAPVAQVAVPAALSEHAGWEALSADDRARAQAYMLQHLRRHSMANRAHPIPIAKLATYQPQVQPARNE